MNTQAYFIFKVLFSGLVIAFASWLAGRRPALAGFIVALPLVSILSILLTYAENRSMEKVNEYVSSILVAVPLSLTFFLPFVLNRWLRLNFFMTFSLGIALLFLAYLIHSSIFNARS